jgi:protein-tyrosine-phosphatase
MKQFFALVGVVMVVAACVRAGVGMETSKVTMYAALETFIQARIAEFDEISPDRKEQLEQLAGYVQRCVETHEPCRLNFICTHNSRRSHMSQLWAATAAAYYRVPGVYTYSGGTESTAFNPRAVAALGRAGFQIAKTTEDRNPVYHVRFNDTAHPMTCFSKVFNQAPNPKAGFCAVMTCSHADKACPAVRGATARFAIPYEDPKVADNTPNEASKYDERCRQIAREMLYLFSNVKLSGATGV